MNRVPGRLVRLAPRRNFSTSRQLLDFEQTEAIKYYVPKTAYYQNYIMKMQEFGTVPGRQTYTHLVTTKARIKVSFAHLFGFIIFISIFSDRMEYTQIMEFFKKKE